MQQFAKHNARWMLSTTEENLPKERKHLFISWNRAKILKKDYEEVALLRT